MTDNELIKEIIKCIKDGLTALSIANVTVQQSFQPTNQGVPDGRAMFIYKVGDHRYGHVSRKDEWVPPVIGPPPVEGFMRHTERQVYETTFQVSTLAIQNPADLTSLTASDLANYASAIMQSDATIKYLRSKGVGILRVLDVRNPYFIDDKGRHEASPSFDFTLTHQQVIISTSPAVETTEFNVHRV